jgi:RNA polymerase sigma-70 factor (ECF subfamily)
VPSFQVTQHPEEKVEFYDFDEEYLHRLRQGDADTERHFVAYFEQLLSIKLRARLLPPDKVKDLSQETFIRVIVSLRKEGGVRQPARFGSFVNSICNNVLFESQRADYKNTPLDDSHYEIPEKKTDLDHMIDSQRIAERVRDILNGMPVRDQQILRAIFLEEKEKDEVCQKFNVKRDYLRVLVHRAKDRFRVIYRKDLAGPKNGRAAG